MVEEPEMSGVVWVQSTAAFKVKKEFLPLEAEATGDIVPQSFDARIVDTAMRKLGKVFDLNIMRMLTGPRCTSHDSSRGGLPSIPLPECSLFHGLLVHGLACHGARRSPERE